MKEMKHKLQIPSLYMKRLLLAVMTLLCVTTGRAQYVPTEDNIEARRAFEGFRFGIFLHWGIYSEFAQGEWYLNSGLSHEEYSKAASCFYPVRFNADEWVRAIKESGARYITFTSRHHDGFSMFRTRTSKYNIVDATPFGRDVLGELSAACHREGIRLHLYYSILDWMRPDYPVGRTGLRTGRDLQPNYDSYFGFMKTQLTELLTGYGDIGAIWLDGYWDHDQDSVPFNWRMPELYRHIHSLKSSCLIGNNHHITPIEGEDFQMFERDLPGENTAGLSGQDISSLPLEMCQTMNGLWGYKVADQNYKSVTELIRLIVRAAAKGSNLLLNIGPQPNGQLPAAAIERLQGIGQWMKRNGESIYGTTATPLGEQPWGATTQKQGHLYLHIFDKEAETITLPWTDKKPHGVCTLADGSPVNIVFNKRAATLTLTLPEDRDKSDFVIDITR